MHVENGKQHQNADLNINGPDQEARMDSTNVDAIQLKCRHHDVMARFMALLPGICQMYSKHCSYTLNLTQ
jgi:hypothetical protein